MLELGPCRIKTGGNYTERNPYSWTRNSSMIFVDQPVGTGLSYVDSHLDIPTTSAIAAEDMYIFLQIFMTDVFPERRQTPFHIAGESYAVCFFFA
jgi:cathepsin A (carboxypeptidase C)